MYHLISKYGHYQNYLKANVDEFIINFDVVLSDIILNDISDGLMLKGEGIDEPLFKVDYIESDEYEIAIIKDAIDYLSKYNRVNNYLIERCERLVGNKTVNKNSSDIFDYVRKSQETNRKIIYLSRRLKKIGGHVNIKQLLIKNNQNQRKTPNLKLVNGERLNISERYQIADSLCNIYSNINEKNISATDKHTLLAHILGCNQQTARELFNGTHQKRTPVREKLMQDYLDNFK